MQPLVGVELLVTTGNHPNQAMTFINFLVVNTPSVYNVIIGCLTLNALRVVTSTYHLAMNFPTATGVGVIYGN